MPNALLVMFPGFVCEHGVIEDVENIPLEFYRKALANVELLENSHVPLRDSGLANAVAPGITDRTVDWCSEGGGIKEVFLAVTDVVVIVQRRARVVRVSLTQSLVGGIAAEIHGKRATILCAEERVDGPALANQFRYAVNFRHVINDGEIDVPRCIEVRGSVPLADVIRVLIVRKEGATAIGGTSVERSGPGVVDLPREAMNVPQFVGDLQTIVVRIAVVIQLEDMIVLWKARTDTVVETSRKLAC